MNAKYVADNFIAKRQRPIFNQRLWTYRAEVRKRIAGEMLPERLKPRT
jgi:hypothetical protein